MKDLFVTKLPFMVKIVGCLPLKKKKKEEMKIVATGGLASLLQSTELLFDNVEENLTMHGLRLIFDYNIKSIDSL